MIIFGFSGTIGSGKDTLADYLQDKYGLLHVSTGDIVRQYAMAKYGSVERPVLRTMSKELRKKYGSSVLADKSIDMYKSKSDQYQGLIITGIRSIGEAEKIKELGGKMVYVDAPVEVRYARTVARQRDAEADLTLEQYIESEQAEMVNTDRVAGHNIAAIGDMSDIKLINNMPLAEFYAIAEKELGLSQKA